LGVDVYLTEAERIKSRAEKIESWFDYLDGLYGDLMSRPEETSSLAGWNDAPKTRPCECRIQWQRGRLCLACDNSGWRKLAVGEIGVDPYSVEIKPGWKKKEDDPPPKDSYWDIQGLERNALIRDGLEIPEGKDAYRFRSLNAKLRIKPSAPIEKQSMPIKILWGLALLLHFDAEAVRRASREALARALAHILPGRLYAAPA
jgi:hypothetical protein